MTEQEYIDGFANGLRKVRAEGGDNGDAAEIGTVGFSTPDNGMVTFEVIAQDEYDDGLRECGVEQIEWVVE